MEILTDEFFERIMRKYNHLYYNPKKDVLVAVEWQNWAPENKLMASIHNQERCVGEKIFDKSHVYIGEIYDD